MRMIALLAALAVAAAPAPRDWGAALRADAQALHDDVAVNHPGPVNRYDPGFARRNDAQLALALERAATARTYGDYFFALREYAASFNDGHVSFGAYGDTPNDFRWPGFLTSYDDAGAVHVVIADRGAPVAIGDRLVGCDGRSADRVGADILGRMWGRWQLDSQRRQCGSFLFLDEGNRYIRYPVRCTFATGGRRRAESLVWRPISVGDAWERLSASNHAAPRTFGARVLPDGTRWYSMPSFDGDPGTAAGKALPPLIAGIAADRAALAAAPAIVLDLRGNGGGSSEWSHQIAQILWGRDRLARLPANGTQIDWRASRANLAAIQESYAARKASLSPEADRWYRTVIAGLGEALARGDALWRQVDDENLRTPPNSPLADRASSPRLHGRVYFVTDDACASACLDAVDLWRALGAIHIGRSTSVDTLYMEVRRVRLPSGLTGVSVPMKVYRDRPRGDNVPVVPVHRYAGDMRDTAALERWVAGLPR